MYAFSESWVVFIIYKFITKTGSQINHSHIISSKEIHIELTTLLKNYLIYTLPNIDPKYP